MLIQVTPKKRESLGNSEYGSQRKSHDDDHHAAISTFTKGYATKLQEVQNCLYLIASFIEESTTKHTTHLFSLNWQSEERKRDLLAEIMLEERRGRELSTNLKELLIENSSEADEKPSRTRKVSITILKSNLWLDFFLLVTCFCFITEEQGPEQEVVHVFDR